MQHAKAKIISIKKLTHIGMSNYSKCITYTWSKKKIGLMLVSLLWALFEGVSICLLPLTHTTMRHIRQTFYKVAPTVIVVQAQRSVCRSTQSVEHLNCHSAYPSSPLFHLINLTFSPAMKASSKTIPRSSHLSWMFGATEEKGREQVGLNTDCWDAPMMWQGLCCTTNLQHA